MKIQLAKEERKKSESDLVSLQHRIYLLRNQEKIIKQKFERTKSKLEQIIDNRKFINYENSLNLAVKEERERQLERKKQNVRKIKQNLKHPKSVNKKSKYLDKLNKIRAHSATVLIILLRKNKEKNISSSKIDKLRKKSKKKKKIGDKNL